MNNKLLRLVTSQKVILDQGAQSAKFLAGRGWELSIFDTSQSSEIFFPQDFFPAKIYIYINKLTDIILFT